MTTNQSSNLRPCPFCGGQALTKTFFDCDDLEYMPLDIVEPEVTCENERCINGWWLSPNDWNTRPIEDELRAENVRLNSWLDEVIKQGNYLEHTLRLAYEHVNGHAFVHGWRDMVNHIQKEREDSE